MPSEFVALVEALKAELRRGGLDPVNHLVLRGKCRAVLDRILAPTRPSWLRPTPDFAQHGDTLATLAELLYPAAEMMQARRWARRIADEREAERFGLLFRAVVPCATCCWEAGKRAGGTAQPTLTDAALDALLDETPAAAVVPLRRRA
jgi:hypothetical protein